MLLRRLIILPSLHGEIDIVWERNSNRVSCDNNGFCSPQPATQRWVKNNTKNSPKTNYYLAREVPQKMRPVQQKLQQKGGQHSRGIVGSRDDKYLRSDSRFFLQLLVVLPPRAA